MLGSLHALLRDVDLAVPAGLADAAIHGVTSDSRAVTENTLFLGLPGVRVDGGRFWRQALEAGAAAAMISPQAAAFDPPAAGDPVLVLQHQDSVAQTLGEVSAAYWSRPCQRLGLVGVTGTNGKTTVTHLIEHLATAVGSPTALFGTLVNRWPGHSITATHTTAVADRLQGQLAQAAAAGCSLAAMEVSSHALDQQRVAGCRFAGAVFTNLTQDHLDYHHSMEAYFEAKARLFEAPLLLADGPRAVINSDDPWGQRLAERLGRQAWRCSLQDSAAELQITDLQMTGQGVRGRLISPAGSGAFQSPLLGRFNLMNLLQAVGVLVQQNLPLPSLLAAIESFRGVPGRMERVVLGAAESDAESAALPTVLVDYAHTPDGLDNALMAARPFVEGRLICVFGCGGDRDRGKRAQMAAIAARRADGLVITSDNPRTEDPQQILRDVVAGLPAGRECLVEVDRAAAIAAAVAEAGPEDLVLIAGKGHEDYQILGTERIHFDDREEAEKSLKSRLHR